MFSLNSITTLNLSLPCFIRFRPLALLPFIATSFRVIENGTSKDWVGNWERGL
ncbi:hypothetical protein V6Z12_A10G198300 [Gossypium hirsutum]